MIFITRWNLKTMISILIFTFYIICQICFITLYQISIVFLIFEIKYCLTEILEHPGGGSPALNVITIRDQRHDKEHYWLTPTLLTSRLGPDHITGKCFFIEKWTATRMLVSSQAIAIKNTHIMCARTHTTTTTTITHIKEWSDLDFISDTVTIKRQWL